ncbi:hypothetical protein [Cognatishimia activa]|uniref:hypothetical protein n=1 Tax=Cognatishimia activa TaxID=1715691 RepID=UPI002231B514|nr:hypothetical protein [Cognatishimia activa]UZD91877.1 hypothetical protein M0D42_04465 [Cognatishimia activa]
MKSISISLVISFAVLAGCQTTTNGDTVSSASQWKQAQEVRSAKLNSPARLRFSALTDEEGFAAFAVAAHIFERCDGMEVSKFAQEYARPTFNRAAVFKGKDKVAAAFERAKANFAAKYGKPLISDANHCDAAQREIKEQTAASFFFDTSNTGAANS